MNVFISYRRNDTQDLAGRIADRLRAVPQIQRVFLDADGIAPGTDFATRIHTAVADSSVCLLLIGPRWRGVTPEAGTARIWDEGDFVRQEAAAALRSAQRVLPVLANGASMPQSDDLPEDLRRLPAINALSVRHMYFDHDVEYLIEAVLSRKKAGTLSAYFKRHPFQRAAVRAMAGACFALAALIAVAVVHASLTTRSLEESLGGPGLVWLLIVGVMSAGVVVAVRGGGRRRQS